MKRLLMLVAVFAFSALPLFSQSSGVGLSLGAGTRVDGDFDFDLGDQVFEIFYVTDLEPGTGFKLKLGRIENEDGSQVGAPGLSRDGSVEYAQALIEYRFYEVFGSTSLFAGPGAYRSSYGSQSETDFGLAAGVNGIFPVTRRFAFTAELAYHWVNFEEDYRFVTATGGVKFAF